MLDGCAFEILVEIGRAASLLPRILGNRLVNLQPLLFVQPRFQCLPRQGGGGSLYPRCVSAQAAMGPVRNRDVEVSKWG